MCSLVQDYVDILALLNSSFSISCPEHTSSIYIQSLFPHQQPATTLCIHSQPKMEKTSRIFCPFIWMQFSSLVYESRISGEF